jgi:putative MATE family efflux protein
MTTLRRYKSVDLIKEALFGDTNRDFTQGSIGAATFLLAVPMILEMAAESIFAIVDIFFVSQLNDPGATATIGFTEGVLTLLYAVAIGLSMGVTAMVARRIGEKNNKAANVVAGQALWIGAFISIVVAILGVIFARDILKLMGAEAAVLETGSNYTTIMFGGSFTVFFLFLNNAIFRGAGDAKIAMHSLWLANIINIILDPCLIFGWGPFPAMGVTGAAVATNIGRGIGVAYQLYFLFSARGRIQVGLKDLGIRLPIIWELLKVSMGGIAQFLIATASWVILVRIVATFGTNAIAGYTVAVRIIMFSFLPAWGLSNTAATLVGQNLGAKEIGRATRTVLQVGKYNFVYMALVSLCFYFFPVALLSIFTEDPEIIDAGQAFLRTLSYGFSAWSIGLVAIQAYNGAGDTMTPTWINFGCFWLVETPLAYAFAIPLGLGAIGVAWGAMVASLLFGLVGMIWFYKGNWKTVRV